MLKKMIQNSKKNLNLKQKLAPSKTIAENKLRDINRQSNVSKTSTVFNDFPIRSSEIFLKNS